MLFVHTTNDSLTPSASRTSSLRSAANVLWVWLIHGGIDPTFHKAAQILYAKELKNQKNAWEAYKFAPNPQTFSAKSALLFALRTRRLIKFTEYHAEELNDRHTQLLQDLYLRIHAIKKVRKALFISKLPWRFKQGTQDLKEIHSFRLLGELRHENLKRCA